MAKAVGVYRPGSIAAIRVRKLKAEGLGRPTLSRPSRSATRVSIASVIAGAGTGAGHEGSAVPRRER